MSEATGGWLLHLRRWRQVSLHIPCVSLSDSGKWHNFSWKNRVGQT